MITHLATNKNFGLTYSDELERAEEFVLPPEALNMTQALIQLMGNASYYHSSNCRKALL